MPSGCWEIVGPNQITPTHFRNPNAIFSTGNAAGPAHIPYSQIASNSIVNLFNPTPAGDANFNRDNIAMTIDAQQSWIDRQSSAGYYGIYDTFVRSPQQ